MKEIAEDINYEQDQGGGPILTGISPAAEGQACHLKIVGQVTAGWEPCQEAMISRSSTPAPGDLGLWQPGKQTPITEEM